MAYDEMVNNLWTCEFYGFWMDNEWLMKWYFEMALWQFFEIVEMDCEMVQNSWTYERTMGVYKWILAEMEKYPTLPVDLTNPRLLTVDNKFMTMFKAIIKQCIEFLASYV